MGHRATFALIGGGGFTHAEDPELEDFLLSLCELRRPKIGYVGAANNDDPERIKRFHARFKGVSCVLSHFSHAANPDRFEAWAKPRNLIYFSGGDTLRLLRFLRAEGRGAAVANAANQGTIIAGVSAGACCWFDAVLTGSGGDGLECASGLGLLPGSCCPHYTDEVERKPEFERCIAEGLLPDGYGIGDGACLVIRKGEVPVAHSARAHSGVWRVRNDAGRSSSESVPSFVEWKSEPLI